MTIPPLVLSFEDPWWFGYIGDELIVQAREREVAVDALTRHVKAQLSVSSEAPPGSQTGRCGDQAPEVPLAAYRPLCALRAGHKGWHSDGESPACEWSGGDPQ
jgi:hypothetical protein